MVVPQCRLRTAAKTWSLSECIEYAHSNNLQIKQQKLNIDNIELDVKQSKLDLLPSLNGFASHYYSWGKFVDPFTNEFATDRIMGERFSGSTSLPVYNGFTKRNTIKKYQLQLKVNQYSYDKMLDDISLQIANQYVSVLYALENLEIARNQLEITSLQVERTQKLVEAGTLARGDLLNIKSQAATESYRVIQAQNDVELAYLNLAHLLDFPDASGFEVVRPDFKLEKTMFVVASPEAIYSYALDHQPEIKRAELSVAVAEKDLEIAKGYSYPSLSLAGDIGTGYSEATQTVTDYVTMPVEIGTTANGVAVYSDQTLPSSYKTEDYGTQLDNNLSRSLTLQLNIPVFNNFTTRTNIAKAKLQREKTAYDLELEKQNLRKIIQSAYADARAAKNQYLSAKTKLEATREAFNYAEKKFNVGLITSVEYNDAKKELTNAKSELLSAKYQFVFTRTVLDFYLGNPIKLQN